MVRICQAGLFDSSLNASPSHQKDDRPRRNRTGRRPEHSRVIRAHKPDRWQHAQPLAPSYPDSEPLVPSPQIPVPSPQIPDP
jgi:hypothetical protein